jgi:hypothetical protein
MSNFHLTCCGARSTSARSELPDGNDMQAWFSRRDLMRSSLADDPLG